MPILDPSLAFSLLNSYEKKECNLCRRFLPYLFQIASKYMDFNIDTIETSMQFKKDFSNSRNWLYRTDVSKIFRELPDETTSLKKTNLYQYLFECVNEKYKKDLTKQYGFYSVCDHFHLLLFQPLTFCPDVHSWYILATPVAILCINTDTYCKSDVSYLFQLINLEIDLFVASGFSIVLCINLNSELYKEKYEDFVYLMTNHPFIEIHLSSYEINDVCFYTDVLGGFKTLSYHPYIYIYTSFNNIESDPVFQSTIQSNFNNLIPNYQFIHLSVHPLKAFKQVKLLNIDGFQFCRNGFTNKNNNISILLSNIPIFKTKNYKKDLNPIKISGKSFATISKNDFLYLNNQRVKIYWDNMYFSGYVNYEDIHLIRPDFYVEKTVYLTDASEKNLEIIDDLIKEIDSSDISMKGYDSILIKMIFKRKIMLECIKNSVFSYVYTIRHKWPKFHIHNTQLLTILNTCEEFIFSQKKKTHKGIIFQVDTGEGKSCIIHIIAAVLSSMGETVHIVSSNINLSNRDYENSLEFFNKMGQVSTVLLHKNERKFSGEYNSLSSEFKEKFPEKYFHEKCFENSLCMNIIACDKNSGAKVIFSTLANFQYYYLWMMGKYPGEANAYFNQCNLLIDEADSILIDEISNGAILSHSIKTNAAKVLSYVYSNRKSPAETVLQDVKRIFPGCEKVTIDDILDMYSEIDIVNSENFSNGKKYRIEKVNFEENDDLLQLYERYKNDSIKTEIKKLLDDLVHKFQNKLNNTEKTKKVTLRHVVPFDCENKGISERNKEFSGFIQQFIAIKEKNKSKKNDNLIIQNLSMNYMYVSHPFFINLYKKGVCGFTGTIGSEYEISIYDKTYNLMAKKIPRENANCRVDLPKIICKQKEDKKKKIYDEIIFYHQMKNPVLVIFQNYEELKEFKAYLIDRGLKNFNIFNGKSESVRPDKIAGIDGAISIGTNVCGRGIDIVTHSKPLHVILAYYTSNTRMIDQALGRTARQGNKGSSRIICSIEEYLASKIIFEQNEINGLLDVFEIKKNVQTFFIDHFMKTRNWIFSDSIGKQIINNEYIAQMRNSLINVNRFKACNYEFPICMNVKSFLKIQVQKIFSLYNLPNCENTWMIFQRYIREMIFYSLSITIDKVDKEYRLHKISGDYGKYLTSKINELITLLNKYLPEDDPNKLNVVSTYMNIYEIVNKKYSQNALSVIPKWLLKINKQTNKSKFISLAIGFRPYSVSEDSGEKVDTVDGDDQSYHSIQDPELKYYQQKPGQSKVILSITKKIDQIFNEMCNKINEVIQNAIGLNFFLRRTLGGCEFGICYDFGIINIEKEASKYNFLVDKHPLFLFSINVRSSTNAPILAGVLIFCLVYIANVTKTILEFIVDPSKGALKSLKAIVLHLIDSVKEKAKDEVMGKITEMINNKISSLFDPIEEYLINVIEKQIEKLENDHYSEIFLKILDIILHDQFSDFCEKINELFEGKTILKIKNISIAADFLPIDRFFKLGVLLILCISSFMMNFHSRCQRIKYDNEKVAQKFNHDQNVSQALKENSYILNANETSRHSLTLNRSKNDVNKGEPISNQLVLEINIIQAVDVPKMDILTWCDPYVIVLNSSSNEICRTKIVYNTKNPVWNHKFNLHLNISDYSNEVLTFKMKDYDEKTKDDFISKINIPLKSIPISTVIDKWYDMQPGLRTFGIGGKLRISFYLRNSA